MGADYPAAHSMDAVWFAIDERGQIAAFDTGETGPAPAAIADEEDHLAQLAGAWPSDYLRAAETLGLFRYEFIDEASDPLRPYVRAGSPASPLHVDQLPPGLRAKCVRFGLRFDKADRIQP